MSTEVRYRMKGSESSASVSNESVNQASPDHEQRQRKMTKCIAKSYSGFQCFLKFFLVAFCFIYVLLPFVFYTCLWVRQQIVFLTFVNIPPFLNLSNPVSFGLNCPHHLYVQSEPDIKLGTWYIQAKDETCKKDMFPGKNPVVLYLHGNSGSRGGTHRVGLYKMLSSDPVKAHVVAFDYRGYGDSSSTKPTVGGVVSDALSVYKWIRHQHNVPARRIFIWGHSLGTGVGVYLMARLNELGEHPAGLILESPFDQLHNVVAHHPLSRLHRIMPGFQQIFVDPIKDEPTTNFDSLSRVDKVSRNLPLLIFHAEDDAMVPYDQGLNLFKKFKESRGAKGADIKFVDFGSHYGYGHKYIFSHPSLPDTIKSFFDRNM